MINYRFIEEKPLDSTSEESIQFGHEEIISSLNDIVKTCPAPFTIGLFGKWGSGKSTIAESMRIDLVKINTPVIIFDVWKHEGDALRRTFLIELERQLKGKNLKNLFNEEFNLSEQVGRTVSKITEVSKIKWSELVTVSLVIFVTAFPIIVIAIIFYLIFVKWLSLIDLTSFTFKSVITILLGSIPFLIKFTDKFIQKKKTEEFYDKFQDPHEFEKEFRNILLNLKVKRIIIIFDNLDRVSGENAVKIISTIKTFLEPADKDIPEKEVVFLIPCDVDAIKDHLRKIFVHGNGGYIDCSTYADEFLRKFFNSIIWIPEFHTTELERFARQKLKETLINDFDNDILSSLITRVFSQNPRQIIQFINVLIANYLIIYKRETTNRGIEKDFLKNNIAQLAKYILLIQKFPSIIDAFRNSNTFNLAHLDYEALIKINHDIQQSHFDEFRAFLQATSDIYIESLEVFFRLRKSDHEQNFPGISRLLRKISQNRFEDDEKYISELKINEKINDFSDVLIQHLFDDPNPNTFCVFINGLFCFTNRFGLTLTDKVYNEIDIRIRVSLDHLTAIYPTILATELIEKYQKLRLQTKRNIMSRLVDIVEENTSESSNKYKTNQEYLESTLQLFIKYPEIVIKEDKERIKIILTKFYQTNLDVAVQLVSSAELQNYYISSDYIKAFIDSLDINFFENNSFEIVEGIILKFNKSFINSEISNSILVSLQKIIKAENAKPIEGRLLKRSNTLDFTFKIIKEFQGEFGSSSEETGFLQLLIGDVIAGYTSQKWKYSYLYIPTILILQQSNISILSSKVKQVINDFFANISNTSLAGIDYIHKRTKLFIKEFDNVTIQPHLENFAVNNKEFFETYYPFLTGVMKENWLTKIITADQFERVSMFIKKQKGKIPSRKILITLLLQKALQGPPQPAIEQIFNLIELLKLKGTEIDKSLCIKTVKSIIMQINDINLQLFGLTLLKKTRILDSRDKDLIINDAFIWLLNPNNNLQYNVLDLINDNFTILNEKKKKSFLNFVFEKYIYGTSNELILNKGFEVLLSRGIIAKINYQKSNFNKVLNRIKFLSLNDREMANKLISGIKQLQPEVNRNKLVTQFYLRLHAIKNVEF